MRQGSERLVEVLSGSFEREVTVNVFNGTDRPMVGERFESWQLDADMSGKVCADGSGVLVHAPVDGVSVSPSGTRGVLSPFRARVELVMTIRDGGFSESVSLGLFRVTRVPSAVDTIVQHDGRDLVAVSTVGLKFLSLDEDVNRWGFRFPEPSAAGASAYGEIRRLTGMPLEQTVPDVLLPTGQVWEAKQGGRLDAVHDLGRTLGGTAVVNSRGAWVVIPDVVGEPVVTLRLGELGTVIDVADEIDTDGVYNEVVGSFEDANGNPFHSVASVTVGDLSTAGDYKPYTRYYASDLVKTQAQGDTAVQAVLDLSVGSQAYDVQVQCIVNPLVEIGDVAALEGHTRPLVGQVRKVSLSDSEYMNVTLRVHRELS